MNTEIAISEFLKSQVSSAEGARLIRLEEGLGHAEKLFLERVWHPAFGHFEHLYAEYEVQDFKDGQRYLDFAYIRGRFRVCIEIDGYGPHYRDMNRAQFSDQWNRQNHLIIDGWKMIRFPYDDLTQRPRRCQQILQQLIGRWVGEHETMQGLNFVQREIVRFALICGGDITLNEAAERLDVGVRHAALLLKELAAAKVFIPSRGVKRIHAYRLAVNWDLQEIG